MITLPSARAECLQPRVDGGDLIVRAGEVLTWVSWFPGAAPLQDQRWRERVGPLESAFVIPVVGAGIRVTDADVFEGVRAIPAMREPAAERLLTADGSLPSLSLAHILERRRYRMIYRQAWRLSGRHLKVSTRSAAIADRWSWAHCPNLGEFDTQYDDPNRARPSAGALLRWWMTGWGQAVLMRRRYRSSTSAGVGLCWVSLSP